MLCFVVELPLVDRDAGVFLGLELRLDGVNQDDADNPQEVVWNGRNDEGDLLPLGRMLAPDASLLGPRGKVLENGMPRFFRRLAEGLFDLEDLARRTDELARFVDDAADSYGFDRARVVGLGFSNGANIAASMLLRLGPVLRGGLLLSPMLPFEPATLPDLSSVTVFVGAGMADAMIPPAQARRLVDALRAAGADVTDFWHPAGHTITHEELRAARGWLAAHVEA